MKNIENAELKAYRKPVIRVIEIKSENIIANSGEIDPIYPEDE